MTLQNILFNLDYLGQCVKDIDLLIWVLHTGFTFIITVRIGHIFRAIYIIFDKYFIYMYTVSSQHDGCLYVN